MSIYLYDDEYQCWCWWWAQAQFSIPPNFLELLVAVSSTKTHHMPFLLQISISEKWLQRSVLFEDIQISSEASNTNIQIFAITSSLSFSGLFPLAPGPRSIQHSASQWCCWRRKISWEPLHGQPWCPAWNLHARLTFLGVPLQELKPWQQSRPCLIALPSQLAFKTQ